MILPLSILEHHENTRLYQACLDGAIDVVNELLDQGGDVNLENDVSHLAAVLSFILYRMVTHL
jgi:ankyrin repeat protein